MAKSKSTTPVPDFRAALEALVSKVDVIRKRINVCATALKTENTATAQEVFDLLDALSAEEIEPAIERSRRALGAHAKEVRRG